MRLLNVNCSTATTWSWKIVKFSVVNCNASATVFIVNCPSSTWYIHVVESTVVYSQVRYYFGIFLKEIPILYPNIYCSSSLCRAYIGKSDILKGSWIVSNWEYGLVSSFSINDYISISDKWVNCSLYLVSFIIKNVSGIKLKAIFSICSLINMNPYVAIYNFSHF